MLLVFLVTAAVTFALVLVASRPTAEERQVQARMTALAGIGIGFLQRVEESPEYLKREESEKIGPVERLLGEAARGRAVRRWLLQTGSKATVDAVAVRCAIAGSVAAVTAWITTGMAVIALAAAGVGAALPALLLHMKRTRRIATFGKALPECADMLTRSLRAGHSVQAALSIAGEQAPVAARAEFTEVFRQQNYGLPLRDALLQMLERMPSQDLRVLVTAILVQKDTGGNLAEMLDKTTAVIRERVRIQGEIRTHTAQGRMTGYILCAMPFVMLVLINMINPGYSNVLFQTPTGHHVIYLGLGLLSVGAWLIRRIVRGIEV